MVGGNRSVTRLLGFLLVLQHQIRYGKDEMLLIAKRRSMQAAV